jgi:hypothetical protein
MIRVDRMPEWFRIHACGRHLQSHGQSRRAPALSNAQEA